MIEKKGNYDSCEAHDIKQRSEYLKCVTDFSRYILKEHIEASDGEKALLIVACDSTMNENGIGSVQCVLGRGWLVSTGLAQAMKDSDNSSIFRMARRMADDYGDLSERRKKLRRKRRMFYLMTSVTALWTCCIIAFQILGIAEWITTVSNLLLMAFAGSQLWAYHTLLKHKFASLERDESDHLRNMIERGIGEAMQRILGKLHSEQDDDDDDK